MNLLKIPKGIANTQIMLQTAAYHVGGIPSIVVLNYSYSAGVMAEKSPVAYAFWNLKRITPTPFATSLYSPSTDQKK